MALSKDCDLTKHFICCTLLKLHEGIETCENERLKLVTLNILVVLSYASVAGKRPF